MKQAFLQFCLVVTLFVHSTSASAPAPAPPGPTNLTAILEKAGQFTLFIRLLQSTKVGNQINTQLNTSNQGLTVFAPTDSSFSSLKSGILNSLTDEQKVELIQFHVLPAFFGPSQFQTASNPMRTQAGGSEGQFVMNVTASGNQVNITTGENNATVVNTVYTDDDQLAVYQVDHVLLPLTFFVPPPPPSKPEKTAESPDAFPGTASLDSSEADYYSKWDIRAISCITTFMVLLAMLT